MGEENETREVKCVDMRQDICFQILAVSILGEKNISALFHSFSTAVDGLILVELPVPCNSL